jgi:hypothetical protein
MNFSSLPQYPAKLVLPSVEPPSCSVSPISSQLRRTRTNLLLAIAIVTLLLLMHRSVVPQIERPQTMVAPALPIPTNVDFEEVEAWYYRERLHQTREEVEAEIGLPTERLVWTRELVELTAVEEHMNRHFGLPTDRVWVRWTDTKNPSKSVTVLFAAGKVYRKIKKGF